MTTYRVVKIEIIFISHPVVDASLSKEVNRLVNLLVSEMSEDTLTRALSERSKDFHQKFDAAFPLAEFSGEEQKFAKAAMSNLIGGMG